MADIQTLEQRFEGISVQDENHDTAAPPQPKHQPKVCTSSSAGRDTVLTDCAELTQSCYLPLEPRRINDSSTIAHETPSPETRTERWHKAHADSPHQDHPSLASRATTLDRIETIRPAIRPPTRSTEASTETMAPRHVRNRQATGQG